MPQVAKYAIAAEKFIQVRAAEYIGKGSGQNGTARATEPDGPSSPDIAVIQPQLGPS